MQLTAIKLTMDEIWDLFEPRLLFRARNPDHELDDAYHLAEMKAVLGEPPLEFLARSETSCRFWDGNGLCSVFPSFDNIANITGRY